MSIRLSPKALKKIVAGSVTVAFVFTTVGEPFAQTSFWADRQAAKTRTAGRSLSPTQTLLASIDWPKETLTPLLDNFKVSGNLGVVVETHSSPAVGNGSQKTLIHIQDAHGVFDAQLNAAQILAGLRASGWGGREGGVTVFQEGGTGPAATDELSNFPFSDVREEVGRAFLRQKEITGEEYEALVSSSGTFRLVGVETPALYVQNLACRHDTASARAAADRQIALIQAGVDELKRRSYPPALLTLEDALKKYESHSLEFEDYVRALVKGAGPSFREGEYPQLTAFLNLLRTERDLDASALAVERTILIRHLADRLSPEAVRDMAEKATSLRAGRATQREFYEALLSVVNAVRQKGEDIPTYRLQRYVTYLRQAEEIRHALLLTESEKLRDQALETLSGSDRVRRVVRLDRRLVLEKLLWRQELTPDQYAALRQEAPLDWPNVVRFLAEEGIPSIPNDFSWTANLPHVQAYYELAEKRDHALSQNALDEMDRTGIKRAVLIAGGFHTPGMTRSWREQGINYVVVQPRFDLQEQPPAPGELNISNDMLIARAQVREMLGLGRDVAAPSPGQGVNSRLPFALLGRAIFEKVLAAVGPAMNERKEAAIQALQSWMDRGNFQVYSVAQMGQSTEDATALVFGKKNNIHFVMAYRESGNSFVVIDAKKLSKDVSGKYNRALTRQLEGLVTAQGINWQGFVGSISAMDLDGAKSAFIRDLSPYASQIVDFAARTNEPLLSQSKEGEELMNRAVSATQVASQAAPSRVKASLSKVVPFFTTLRQKYINKKTVVMGAFGLAAAGAAGATEIASLAGAGFWAGLATQVGGMSHIFDLANAVGSLSAYSPAVGAFVGALPVLVVFGALGFVIFHAVFNKKMAKAKGESGLNQEKKGLAPAADVSAEESLVPQKSLFPLIAGSAVAAVFFLWLLPFSVSFLTTPGVLSATLAGALAPVFLLLNVSSGVSFWMVALSVGWMVSSRSKEYNQKQWAIVRVAVPAVLTFFTSGLFAFGLMSVVTLWTVTTSSLSADKYPALAPFLNRSNEKINALRAASGEQFKKLLPGTSPPKNRLGKSAYWSAQKLFHGTVDLWGTFKGFAFQSAVDLLAIYNGTSEKKQNQLTAAERGYRAVLTVMRGGSLPGSSRHSVAQALGLPALILFYTLATVNRRVGLLIMSTVASFTGTQMVGGVVSLAFMGGGVGGIIMGLVFLVMAGHFYIKFGRKSGTEPKELNARMVLFAILSLGAFAVGILALGGADATDLLGKVLSLNLLDTIPFLEFDSHSLTAAAQSAPHDHALQIKHAFVQLLGPSAWLGSVMLGLLMTIKNFSQIAQLQEAEQRGVSLSGPARVLGWMKYSIHPMKLLWNGTLEDRRKFLKGVTSTALGLQTVNPEVALVVGGAAYMEGLGVGLDPVAAVVRKIEDTQSVSIMGLSNQLTDSVSLALFGQAGQINLHDYGVIGTDRTNNELIQMTVLRDRISKLKATGDVSEPAKMLIHQFEDSLEKLKGPRAPPSSVPPSDRPQQGNFRGLFPMVFDILFTSAHSSELTESDLATSRSTSKGKPLQSKGETAKVAGFPVTNQYLAERGLNPKTGESYVDIACPAGTPLVAPKDLTILEVGTDESRGHYAVVGIEGERFTFMHLNEPVAFERGDRVVEKTVFAQTGHTGNITGNNGGDHVSIEFKDRDGQPQDPLISPLTADFLAHGRPATTEIATGRGSSNNAEVKNVTDALAKVGETTSVQVANLKTKSAKLFVQEIIAKFFKADLEFAASRVETKKTISSGTKEILNLNGTGSEPAQVKKYPTEELQVNLLINAIIWNDDLTKNTRVRQHAAKMRDLMAEIETTVNVPRTVVEYFLDIESADSQLKFLREDLKNKQIQKGEIEEKIATGQENGKRLRDRYNTDISTLKNSIIDLEGQREEFVMRLFNLLPGLWPAGTTWPQARATAKSTVFEIDNAKLEEYLRLAGAANASRLKIKLAWEKAAMLKAAIPAHRASEGEINVVLNFLRIALGQASGGLSLALDAVARVVLHDPELESKENAGVWAYARAVLEAEEVERQENYANELSKKERDHQLRQVASMKESLARGMLELAALRERMNNGQLAYRDVIEAEKTVRRNAGAYERAKREAFRWVVNAAIFSNPKTQSVDRPDSEASPGERIVGFFGAGSFLDLFRDPDAKAKEHRVKMEKDNERIFAPVDIRDPIFLTGARMVLDRSSELRQARMGVNEAREKREAIQRSVDLKWSGYGRGLFSGGSKGGGTSGEFSVGIGVSKTWDPARDFRDLELARQEEIAKLTEAELTSRQLTGLGSQMWLLDHLLGKRSDLAKTIETYQETIRLNEGMEKGSSLDQMVRLSQARSALDDASRDQEENEHRIKSVTTGIEQSLVVTPQDKVIFSNEYRAKNIFTSIPFLQYEKYIQRNVDGDKIVDALNEEGRTLLDRTGRELVEAQSHLEAMKVRLPLLRAKQVAGIFAARGEIEKASQAKALVETFEREFAQGNSPHPEVVQEAVHSLSVLTENERLNFLPDAVMVSLMETHLKDFAKQRNQTLAQSKDTPDKFYKSLRDLSEVALRLLAIKASMSPALKWGSPEGMALDRLVSDWDESFRGRFDPYTSQRIALKKAEAYQAGATVTDKSEPMTINIDFISLFMGGTGTRVGTSFNPAQIPLALFKIPQKKVEDMFAWSRPMVDNALKSDPEGLGKFLSKWVPGYQSSVLRDRSISAQLRRASLEILTADQRWKDVINAQDSFITQLVLAEKIQTLIHARVEILEKLKQGQEGLLPETDLRIAENKKALLDARRELGEYNKRVFDLKISLLGLGIDPNNLPHINDQVDQLDRVTFSYAELASLEAVETRFAKYRAMFQREEFLSSSIAQGIPQMPITVGVTGDGQRKAAFVSWSLYGPELATLKSDVDAAEARVEEADLLVREAQSGQTGRINGDMLAFFTGAVRREMSKEMYEIAVRRMTLLRGHEESNAANIHAQQFLKGWEQGGSGADGARYRLQTTFGRTKMDFSVNLPDPMDILPIGKAIKTVLKRIPVTSMGIPSLFGENEGRHSEQARRKVKEQELRSEIIRGLLPTIDLTAFTQPINGKTLTLSVRWNLAGGGGPERAAIIETEMKEIQARLEEKQRVHKAFVEQNQADMARSINKIENINREITELTERTRAPGLQKDYINERIQMGDLAAYQSRLADLVATRAYEFWLLGLKYQSTADILKVYGQNLPPLDDVFDKAGIGIVPEGKGNRTFYEELTFGPLAETLSSPSTKGISKKEWSVSQVRAQSPLFKPEKVEQNPEPTVSRVLNVLGQGVDVPLTHLSFGGPRWFEKVTSGMAEAIGLPLDNSRLLNKADFAVFMDGILGEYRFPKTPKFMSRLEKAFVAVNREFKDLTDSSEMPNSLSKYTEQAFKERFPYHALLTADIETSMRMDKNFHKKLALALFLASEMTYYPNKDNSEWMNNMLGNISNNIHMGDREKKGHRLSDQEKESYFATRKDLSAAMDRALFQPFFSDGKGMKHASKVKEEYNVAAHEGLKRLFPQLARWTDRINEEKQTNLTRYGNLDEEALISAMTAIGISNGWSPKTLKGYLFFLAETIAPQVGRYTKGATIRDYAQQPDADLLRALLQDYNQPNQSDPEKKAIDEDKIGFLVQSEQAKFIIATSFIWAGEYFKAMKVDAARAVKDPEIKARIAKDFTQTMDRMLALRAMPEVNEIIKRQGAVADGRIFWFSTEVLGILTAFNIDWMREKWTGREMRGHIQNVLALSASPQLLAKLQRYQDQAGIPLYLNLQTKDPAERMAVWGTLSGMARTVERLNDTLDLAPEKMGETLDDLVAIRLALNSERNGLIDKAKNLEALAKAPNLNQMVRQAYIKGASRLRENAKSYHWDIGQDAYIYRLSRNLVPEQSFHLPQDKPRRDALAELVSDYVAAKERNVLAGTKIVGEFQQYLDDPAKMPKWMSRENLPIFIENITGDPSRGIKGLMDQDVGSSTAMYFASAYKQLRGSVLTQDTENMFFLQSIYMSTHKDENGAPQRLQEGEIAPYLDNIRRGTFSRDQTGRVFLYDGWLSRRLKTELPQIMADELAVLRKTEITKEEKDLIRREMFQLRGPEAIGLAFYLVRQQDSYAPGVGLSFEGVDQYFSRWLADSGFVLAQAWDSSGERHYIMPFRILSSNLNMFREGQKELSSHQKFLLGRKFKGVFLTDPGLMDLGEKGNEIRSLRAHYFTMLGEPLTVERELILTERMQEIEKRMGGSSRQDIETAQVDYLAKLRTLREVMSDTMAKDIKPKSGESLSLKLDQAWWSLSTKLADIFIDEVTSWQSRKVEVRRVREEAQSVESVLSEARRGVLVHRSERIQGNEAELSDPMRARAWQGRLALRMPLLSGDVDTFKILYRQGYSEGEIVTRFHTLPSLVLRAFQEATGREIDMSDLQQKGRVMAESDILFEQWGMLSVPSESPTANALLAKAPISVRGMKGAQSLGTVAEGLDWSYERLKGKYARAENIKKGLTDFKIKYDENNFRQEARLSSQANSIAHNATAGAVDDHLLAEWLAVAKVIDATAKELNIPFDKRMSLYYSDLMLRLGLAEFYPREVAQNERIRESGGRSVEWAKNREAAERRLGWIFSAAPVRRPNEHIGDINVVRDVLPEGWFLGAHLEDNLKNQLSVDPNRRAKILDRLADRMTVLGLEETDLVLLVQRAEELLGKLVVPVQMAEEQKSKFEYSAGPQSPLSRFEALLAVDELETNPQRQIKLLPLLFSEYDYLSPEKTELEKKAAGKEIQRFFEKIGAIIYGANRMVELKRFESLGYLRSSPFWSRWLTGDNKEMPSPYGNFMVGAFSISLALFFKKILIGRFIEPLKGLGLFQNKRRLHNFMPNRFYPWKWSAFEFLANFVTFFFAVWSFATWNHLPEALTWISGILLLSVWTYLDRGIRFPQLYLIYALLGGLIALSLSASIWGWALQPFFGPILDPGGVLGTLITTIWDGLTGLAGKHPIYLAVLSALGVIQIAHLVLKSPIFAKKSETPSGVLERKDLKNELEKRGDFDIDFTLPRRPSRLGPPETLDSLLVNIGTLKPGQIMPVLTPFMPGGNTRDEVMEKVEEVLEIKAQELRNNPDSAHVSILLLNHGSFEFNGLPKGKFFEEVDRIIKDKGYYEEFAYTDEEGVRHAGSERFITIAMPPGRKPEVFVRALKLMEYGEDGGPGAMFGQNEYESILSEAREEVRSYLERMGYPPLDPDILLNLTDLSRVLAPFNSYIDGDWEEIIDSLRVEKQSQMTSRRDSLRNALKGYGINDELSDRLDAAEFESEWKRLYDQVQPKGILYPKLAKILLKNIAQSRKDQQRAFLQVLAPNIEKDSVAKEIALQLSLTSLDHFTLGETNHVFDSFQLPDDKIRREILERVADIRAEIMDPPLWQPVRTEVDGKGIWYGPLHLVMERVRAVNLEKMADVMRDMGQSADPGLRLEPQEIEGLVNTFQNSVGDAPLTLALANPLLLPDDRLKLDEHWEQIQGEFKNLVDLAIVDLNGSLNLKEASKEVVNLAQVYIGGLAAGNDTKARDYFLWELHVIAKGRGAKISAEELSKVAAIIASRYEDTREHLTKIFENTGSLARSVPAIFAQLSGKDENSARELLYKSSGLLSPNTLLVIEVARERLKIELDVYFSSPYMDDTPMFTGIFTNKGYVPWNTAKKAWIEGETWALSDPKEVGASIVLGRLMPPKKEPGQIDQRAPIFIVVDDTNKTAQAGGIYQAGVIDENVREDGFRKVRDALKSVLPDAAFEDEFIDRVRESPEDVLTARELNPLKLKERDLLLWEIKIALRNAGQYFLHQARTGYAARLDQATHEQTLWEFDGNLMHNALFPIQEDLFRTSAGGRIFGKYGGKTRSYLQAHSYFPGFPFGAYYSRTTLFSGIGIGRLRVFQGNHDHVNQKVMTGLSNWAKQVFNSEDEINSETPEDAEQIFALMKALVATSAFSFLKWILRGRGGSYEAYRYLEPVFDKMRLSMRPPLPHRTAALVIAGNRTLIFDDRPLGVTFELYRGVQKWISGNDVLNEFGRFFGRSLFQGLHGRSTNNGVLRGLVSGPMFLIGMFTGLVFMWVLPGQVEIARVAAAVFLGWITMVGLVVVMKFLGPLVDSFIHPWPTLTRNRFVQRHMDWYYQIESPLNRWMALQLIRFVWTIPAIVSFIIWKVPLVVDEIGRSNSIYMAYPFPGMGAVGRGLVNVKNMKKHGLMGANAPNMLETQSDVFSKTLSALSSSTAVAMTLFGMYMAAFLPIGVFGQSMIGLFGFVMAGTLIYARFISPSSDWRSTLQKNRKTHLKAYEEAKLRGVDFSSPVGRDIEAKAKIAFGAKVRYLSTTFLSIAGMASIGLFFLFPGLSLPRDWLVWGLLVILSWQVAPFSAQFASVHFNVEWRDLSSAPFSLKALKLRRFTWALGRLRPIDKFVLGRLGLGPFIDEEAVARMLSTLTGKAALDALNSVLRDEDLSSVVSLDSLDLPKSISDLAKKPQVSNDERRQINKAILQEYYADALDSTYRLFGLIPFAITPKLIPIIKWFNGAITIAAAIVVHLPIFDPVFGLWKEEIIKLPVAIASMVAGADGTTGIFAILLSQDPLFLSVHTAILMGLVIQIFWGVSSVLVHTAYLGIQAMKSKGGGPIAGLRKFGLRSFVELRHLPWGSKELSPWPRRMFLGILLVLPALFYASGLFAAPLTGSLGASSVLATVGPWVMGPVILVLFGSVQLYRKMGDVSSGNARILSFFTHVRNAVGSFLQSTGANLLRFGRTGVALGSLAAEKIVKTPALVVALVMGGVGVASAAGVMGAGALGSLGTGATGASAAGVPVLFAMALSAVPAGAGSSTTFFRWNLPSSLEKWARAGGFLATPGVPSTEKKGDALVVDMRAGTLDPAVGKILLDRLTSLGLRALDDPDGKLHIEFVVGNAPRPGDVDRITKAFRELAAPSGLSASAIEKISLGVVAQETEGLKARLTDLSAFHINVVAPADAVEFWSGLGLPLTVFAAKFLNDLLNVEVEIVYTGAAAQAAVELSNGQLKMDKGQVRLKNVATPLKMIDQDKQKIQLFNQQA